MATVSNGLKIQPNPIQRPKLYQLTAQKIEELIRSGELKPGDRLPSERDIMAAYNIGRPAVREAFLSLQNKGLIATESGRRARVVIPSVGNVFNTLDGMIGMIVRHEDNLKNLFDARKVVEVAIARHAAATIQKSNLVALEKALIANFRAIGKSEAFVRTDNEFHHILFQTTGNPIFELIHTALISWLTERWSKMNRSREIDTLAYRGHSAIFKAVAKRNPDAAEKAMSRHISASWKIWMKE